MSETQTNLTGAPISIGFATGRTSQLESAWINSIICNIKNSASPSKSYEMQYNTLKNKGHAYLQLFSSEYQNSNGLLFWLITNDIFGVIVNHPRGIAYRNILLSFNVDYSDGYIELNYVTEGQKKQTFFNFFNADYVCNQPQSNIDKCAFVWSLGAALESYLYDFVLQNINSIPGFDDANIIVQVTKYTDKTFTLTYNENHRAGVFCQSDPQETFLSVLKAITQKTDKVYLMVLASVYSVAEKKLHEDAEIWEKQGSYQLAIKNYLEAAEIYDSCVDYAGSRQKRQTCCCSAARLAMLLADKSEINERIGLYQDALNYFTKADIDDSDSRFQECKNKLNDCYSICEPIFAEAKALIEQGNYAEAAEQLTKIHNYKNSQELLNECLYNTAYRYYLDYKYNDAIDIFRKLIGYKDSEEKLWSCHAALDAIAVKEASQRELSGLRSRYALVKIISLLLPIISTAYEPFPAKSGFIIGLVFFVICYIVCVCLISTDKKKNSNVCIWGEVCSMAAFMLPSMIGESSSSGATFEYLFVFLLYCAIAYGIGLLIKKWAKL